MRLFVLFSLFSLGWCISYAQIIATPQYKIQPIHLPVSLQNQVCISGMVYKQGNLILASERCPLLFLLDTVTFSISQKTIGMAGTFETEGITIYGGNILLISENLPMVYSINQTGQLSVVSTTPTLPGKLKSGDGMEGISANEKDSLVYLLRERNESGNNAQILTYRINEKDNFLSLSFINTIELPLENSDWRYSDICFNIQDRKLLCLKSYAKGKLRKHRIDALTADSTGLLQLASLHTVVPEGFSNIPESGKKEKNSLNFEGLAIDEHGNLYVVSDNTSGAANCSQPSKEKTVLIKLSKTK
jgi:uncharacterized protein YjiK